MRTIAGALLILAASVCFLGGILARSREVHSPSLDVAQVAYFFAAVLAVAGLIFLSRGLATEHERTVTRRHDEPLEPTEAPGPG